MAICGGCGAEARRTRTIFNERNTLVKEECPSCNPNSFDPQWKTARGAMGWEAYPEKYDKITLPDGRVGYRSKEEFRQDSEDKIRAAYARADQPDAAKLEEKRRTRRTVPLSDDEQRAIINRVRPVIQDRQEHANRRWNAAVKEFTS